MSFKMKPVRPGGMRAHNAVRLGQYQGKDDSLIYRQRTGPTRPDHPADSSAHAQYGMADPQVLCTCGAVYADHLVKTGARKGQLRKTLDPTVHVSTAHVGRRHYGRPNEPLPGRPNRKRGSRQPSMAHRRALPASIHVELQADGSRVAKPIEAMLQAAGL